MTGRHGGFKFRLPSPFLLAIVVVFVILPLVWPENVDESPVPGTLAAFELTVDVKSVSISPDGQTLAATCRDRPVDLWTRDGEAGWRRTQLPEHLPGGSRCLAFSPHGELLATGNIDGTISLWDLTTGQLCASLRSGTEMITGVAFSADGALLATSDAESRVLLWDIPTHQIQTSFEGHHGPVTALAFSPTGRYVATGGEDHSVRIWDVEKKCAKVILQGHPDIVLAVAFSPDGRLLASSSLGDSRVRLWDVETGEPRENFEFTLADATRTCMTFTRDGSTIIAGNEHGVVSSWNLATHRESVPVSAHKGWVKTLALSADGRSLITGGNDGFVRMWDPAAISNAVDHAGANGQEPYSG
jgi:WD40 repeat protein